MNHTHGDKPVRVTVFWFSVSDSVYLVPERLVASLTVTIVRTLLPPLFLDYTASTIKQLRITLPSYCKN